MPLIQPMQIVLVSDCPAMRQMWLTTDGKARLFLISWEEFEATATRDLMKGCDGTEYLVFDTRNKRQIQILMRTLVDQTRMKPLKTHQWIYLRESGLPDHGLFKNLCAQPHVHLYSIPSSLQHIVPRFIRHQMVCGGNLHATIKSTLYCVYDQAPEYHIHDGSLPRAQHVAQKVRNSLSVPIWLLAENKPTAQKDAEHSLLSCDYDLYQILPESTQWVAFVDTYYYPPHEPTDRENAVPAGTLLWDAAKQEYYPQPYEVAPTSTPGDCDAAVEKRLESTDGAAYKEATASTAPRFYDITNISEVMVLISDANTNNYFRPGDQRRTQLPPTEYRFHVHGKSHPLGSTGDKIVKVEPIY